MHDLQHKFNKITLRRIRAETYLDNNDTEMETREKYIPEYLKIIRELQELLYGITLLGIPWTNEEALNGFGGD